MEEAKILREVVWILEFADVFREVVDVLEKRGSSGAKMLMGSSRGY